MRHYLPTKVQWDYLYGCIVDENGDWIGDGTHKEALEYFENCYFEEYVKHDNRKAAYPSYNQIKDIAEWLSGLPSAVNIHFWNYDIAKLGREWGYVKTEDQEEEFVENWFVTIASWLVLACDSLGVPIRRYGQDTLKSHRIA